MGLIMAFGLVAKNGILLVDFTNLLRRQGMGRTQALAHAARTRLRPILMTSATMLFGMLPLTFKSEAGAESRAPMAVVVMGAVISSTLLAVIVLPAVYTLFDDLQGLLAKRPVRVPVPAPVTRAPSPIPVPGMGEPIPEPVLASEDAVAPAYRSPAQRGAAGYLRQVTALRARRREQRVQRGGSRPRASEEPA